MWANEPRALLQKQQNPPPFPLFSNKETTLNAIQLARKKDNKKWQ